MRILFILILSLSLTACASFSGQGGQFQTVETVQLTRAPSSFVDTVISVGESLGYQYSGGDRSANTVLLSDQPNFGESVILGRNYTVQLTVTLQPDGRTVEMTFVSYGSRSTAGASRAQERIEDFKAALRERLG